MNCKSSDKEVLTRRANIPDHIESDLQFLEHYFDHDRNNFQPTIFKIFSRQTNAYFYALELMYYSKDFFKGKLVCSLSQLIIESLSHWCAKHDVQHLLTLQVKCLAVERVLQQSSGAFVHLICDIFKIKEDYDYFISAIKAILKEMKFKEAFYLMSSLNAEGSFPLEDFVFPAFFLDKEPWVKHCLEKTPDLQIAFVQKLDNICQNGLDIQEFVRSLPYDCLPIRKHAYDPTRLQKLLANYIEHFDIDIKQCNKLYHVRCANAMNYVLRKRYKEESIGKEAFEEIIKFILDDKPVLQKEFLMKLICFGDSPFALKFAKEVNLNRNEWPEMLQCTAVYDDESKSVDELSDDSSNYLQLRLNRSDIIFIDTPEKFVEAIDDMAQNYDVVGIDAEWRPNLGITKENLSVFQIAVWDAIYLLDVLALLRHPNQKFWLHIIENIFNNKNILKLGYGIKHDLHHLLSICSDKKVDVSKFPGVLDFCEFFKKVGTAYPAVMERIEESQSSETSYYLPSKGLSQLCYTVLGKPLNKDEQFSDWERRPLRERQMTYAALDAYCLLLVYEKLYHVLQGLELDFHEVIKKTFSTSIKAENEKNSKVKKQDIKVEKKSSDYKPVPVSQFKVVVDNMLYGLGKALRVCGADVAFLENDDDHMQALQISQAENRIILSAGAPYQKLSGYVSEDMCFCVPVDENAKEQALIILQHFNVQCKASDIFSRCSICSGNKFKKVSRKELYPLWCAVVNNASNHVRGENNQTQKTFPSKEQPFLSEDGILETGVPVQVSTLSPKVFKFKTVEDFFICEKCGKVYWEGSHFTRVKKFFSKVLDEKDDSRANIYQGSESANMNPIYSASTSLAIERDSRDKMESAVQRNTEFVVDTRDVMSFDVDNSSDDDIDDIVHCG